MTKKENREVLKKNTKYFVYKFIVSLFIRIFLLLIPIYYAYIIDEVTKGNYDKTIEMIILFFTFTMLYRLFEVINQKAYYKLYSNLYKTYLDLGLQKTCNNSVYSLSRFSLSEYSNIMSEDFETLSDYYTAWIIRFVEIIESIYIVVYFFTVNIYIGYVTLFVCLVVLYILFFFQGYIAKTNGERKNRHDKRISLFQELLLSVKEIKGFHIFDVVRERTMTTVEDYSRWNNKLNVDKYNLKQVSLTLVDIFQIVCIFYGIKLILNGQMTLGVLTIIYNYYNKLSNLFLSIITLFETNINVQVAKVRIHKLFQYATANYEGKKTHNNILGMIEFKNVLYGNKKNPTLKNVSFQIEPNSFNIITGTIGTGKSGVFELLLQYNRQHEGSILIDHKDIRKYDFKKLGDIISAVTKNPTFFGISIRDNLSIFDSNFENIIHLCKEFQIHDYIMGLDDGYDTILQTDANNINSDVKYVLAIIRVLLKRTKIMLFDETFDFLSHDINERVLNNIKDMKEDNTIIVVSKNPDFIKESYIDQVIVLTDNQVLTSGKHEELIKENLEYKKFFKNL